MKRTKQVEPGTQPPYRPGSHRYRRRLVFGLVVASCVAVVAGYAANLVWRSKAELANTVPIAVVPMSTLPSASAAPASADAQLASASGSGAQPEADSARPNLPARRSTTVKTMPTTSAPAATGAQTPARTAVPTAANRPYLLFRSTALGDTYGRVSMVYLDALDDARSMSSIACDRVHFSAGAGVCLEALRSGIASYRAHVFDAAFRVKHTVPLAGPPSRTRVSRDGRLAAFTVFISGHSYSSPGFTTRTSIIELASGRLVLEDLEALPVLRDGKAFKAADFNFWGITFARDANHFYATLGTEGKVYLVEGDLAARQMRVIHDDVECPSLSPDDTQIAFKRRAAMDAAGRRIWGLVVLDLATRKETFLHAETRNVDDQVEWLNNREILYAMPKADQQLTAGTDIWAIAADASSSPRLLLPFAFSPVVVR